jgi:hypothetical protein
VSWCGCEAGVSSRAISESRLLEGSRCNEHLPLARGLHNAWRLWSKEESKKCLSVRGTSVGTCSSRAPQNHEKPLARSSCLAGKKRSLFRGRLCAYSLMFTFFEPCTVIYICCKNQQNAHFFSLLSEFNHQWKKVRILLVLTTYSSMYLIFRNIWPSPLRSGLDSRPVDVGFVVDKSTGIRFTPSIQIICCVTYAISSRLAVSLKKTPRMCSKYFTSLCFIAEARGGALVEVLP